MSKSAGQKLRLLYLERLLLERTDEDNPITVQQIIKVLAAMGIAAGRKTIYDDIDVLLQMDMDIVTLHGNSNTFAYYVGEREFELPEIKLLVDMVKAAHCITPAKSSKLISKLKALASYAQARQITRHTHAEGNVKTDNENIYYNIDAIHTALLAKRQIAFNYLEWAVDKTLPRNFGKRPKNDKDIYILSPLALVWDDNNYFLIGYDGGEKKVKHCRVDSMDCVQVLPEVREGGNLFERFGASRYTRMTFGMSGGTPTNMRLRFANHLIGDVVARFGDTIAIHPSGDNHFTINVEVATSMKFTAWLLGFGQDAELLSPQPLRDQIWRELTCLAEIYRNPAGLQKS